MYQYETFSNPNKSLMLCGIFEYTRKDFYNIFKDYVDTFTNNDNNLKERIENMSCKVEKNDYEGIFKGKNLIMIMMESIDFVAIDEETMPTLSKMIREGWSFNNRFSTLYSGGSTIFTEFVSLTSLSYSKQNSLKIYDNYYPYALPNMFSNNNYNVVSAHENNGKYYDRSILHKRLGFQNSYFIYDMPQIEPDYWHDVQFANNEELYKLITPNDNDKPFMSFIVTISAHGPYINRNSCKFDSNIYENEYKCLKYVSGQTDELFKVLLQKLETDNRLNDTVFILYSDHYAYNYTFTDEQLKSLNIIDKEKTKRALPLVIYSPQINHKEIDNIINDGDIAPTILNLFGIDYNQSNYIGNNIFDNCHKNIAYFNDGTWYDGKELYDGNVINNNSNINYVEETTKYVNEKIKISNDIIKYNYYFTNKE